MSTGSYDYIVVGGGSAGAAVAARLSESGRLRVLLLEAGSRARHIWSTIPMGVARLMTDQTVNWSYMAEPDEGSAGRPIAVPRGKMLGGSSAINGMVYVRGQAQDYDHWAQLGNPGWSYADVLPLFRRSETFDGGDDAYRGRSGPLRVTTAARGEVPLLEKFIEAAQSIGIPYNPDFNGERQDGVGMTQMTIHRGLRQSTAASFLDPARTRSNLTVRLGAQAERLMFDCKRCTGVRYRADGRTEEARARREVILAAGAVNSPQLLELSGIGQAERLRALGVEPRHDLPGVGENLRDHYLSRVTYLAAAPGLTLSHKARGLGLVGEVLRYAVTRDGLLASTVVPLRMYVRLRPGLDSPDSGISVTPFRFEVVNNVWRVAEREGFTVTVHPLRPESTGSVHIASADPQAAPSIRFNYLSAEVDRVTTVAGIRKARELVAAAPLQGVAGEETAPGAAAQTDEEILAWARQTSESGYHLAGTCKMGHDPLAVVDHQLKVHGIEGLRVADASIMPTLTSGNTNAPAIMIGEKCAELVLSA